jgi:hypothetical protein
MVARGLRGARTVRRGGKCGECGEALDGDQRRRYSSPEMLSMPASRGTLPIGTLVLSNVRFTSTPAARFAQIAVVPDSWASGSNRPIKSRKRYRCRAQYRGLSIGRRFSGRSQVAVTSTALTKRGRLDGPAAVSSIARSPRATPHPVQARSRSAAGPFAPRQTLSLARANARRR